MRNINKKTFLKLSLGLVLLSGYKFFQILSIPSIIISIFLIKNFKDLEEGKEKNLAFAVILLSIISISIFAFNTWLNVRVNNIYDKKTIEINCVVNEIINNNNHIETKNYFAEKYSKELDELNIGGRLTRWKAVEDRIINNNWDSYLDLISISNMSIEKTIGTKRNLILEAKYIIETCKLLTKTIDIL